MIRKAFITLAAVAALMIPTAAFASQWQVVASKHASGDYAVTVASTTIRHPHKIGVWFHGSGYVVWACSHGYSVSSYSRSYGGGTHILRHTRGASECDVVASVSGSNYVQVDIMKKR